MLNILTLVQNKSSTESNVESSTEFIPRSEFIVKVFCVKDALKRSDLIDNQKDLLRNC